MSEPSKLNKFASCITRTISLDRSYVFRVVLGHDISGIDKTIWLSIYTYSHKMLEHLKNV